MLFISMGHRAERWVEVANVKSNFRKRSLVGGFCWPNMTKKKFSEGICLLNPPPYAPRACGRKGRGRLPARGLFFKRRLPFFSRRPLIFQEVAPIFQSLRLGFQSLRPDFQKAGLKIQGRALAGRGADTEKPFTRRLPPALGPGSRRERFCYCSKAGAAADGASARPQLAGKISGGGSGSSPLRCWDRGCRCFHRLPKWTS